MGHCSWLASNYWSIGYSAFLNQNVNTPSADDILFKIENPVGVVPHTIKCVYDVSNIASDNIKIDFRHKSHSRCIFDEYPK
jgi:hypothetical protein